MKPTTLTITLFFAAFATFVMVLLAIAEWVGFFHTFPLTLGFLCIEIIVFGLYVHWTTPANTKLLRLIELMRSTSRGRDVVVVGENLPCTMFHVGASRLFFRNYRKSGLLSIRVDTVWFIDKAPKDVRQLCIGLVSLSKNPEVIG